MLKMNAAQPTGPTSGRNSDGGIRTNLNYVKPQKMITSSIAVPVTNVYKGNADASGDVSYTDVTAALSAHNGSYETLFDTVNPTADTWLMAIAESDTVVGFGVLVTTAGVYSGTATPVINYKNTSGAWVEVACTIDSQMDTTGMKMITLSTPISGSQLSLVDDPNDPIGLLALHRFRLKFSGITSVTTPPEFDIMIKMRQADDHHYTDISDYLADDVSGIPAAYDTVETFVYQGDRTLFFLDSPFAKLKVQIERRRESADEKVIYSKSDGTFGEVTLLDITSDDPARPDQVGTIDPGATPVEYIDVYLPPEDWSPMTINVEGEDITGYVFGTEAVSSDTTSHLVGLFAYKFGEFIGASGVPCDGAIANGTFRVDTRDPSATEAKFLIADNITGKSTVATLSANEYVSDAPGVNIAAGSEALIQQLMGDAVDQVSDVEFSVY